MHHCILSSRRPGASLHAINNVQIEYGKKGKVVVKLRKAQPGRWIDRWSPRREMSASNDMSAAALPPVNDERSSAGRGVEHCDDEAGPFVTFPNSDEDDRDH